MKGMCQTCGATAPIEWFLAEPVARQVLATALKLPQPVQDQLLGYLALFRPAGGSMQAKKALRLVQEIAALVAPGHIQIKGQVARPCQARVWARGMEQMQERRDALRLPVANHNYLRQIVWALADQEDAKSEARHNQEIVAGGRPSVLTPAPLTVTGEEEEGDGLLPLERDMLAKGMPILKRME